MTELNVCVLGDELVKGVPGYANDCWAATLVRQASEEHGEMNYYNLGIPGETSVQIGQRIRELVPRMAKGQDNRLILNLGMNDTEQNAERQVSANESVDALKTLIVKTKNHMKICVVGLTPVYEPQRNLKVKRLNGMFKELCLKARVPYIDLFGSLVEDVQYKRDLARSGRVFPGKEGHRIIADLIWNDRAWWFN